MAFVRFPLTGGLNTKADATSVADGQLTSAIGCSYDTVGAVSSGRGRLVLNSGVALAGDGTDRDIRGHFDAFSKRYTKSGTSVYQDYATLVGADGAWTGTGHLTGFGYGQYVYLCDGTTVARYNDATDAVETWGLVAPGYQELGASPVRTTTSTTVTITTPAAHGFSAGMAVELQGLEATNGVGAHYLNGRKVIASVPTPTSYTFTNSVSGTAVNVDGGGSAGIQKQMIGTAGVITPGAGGNAPIGTLYYAYTFYNGMAESNFSALAKCVTTADNQAPMLTNILPGPTGTTEIRLYRSDISSKQLYYLDSIPVTGATGYAYADISEKPPWMDEYATAGDAVKDEPRPNQDNDDRSALWVKGRFYNPRQREKPSKNLVAQEVVGTNLGLLSDWTDHDAPPSNLEGVIIVNDQAVGISGNELRFSAVGNPEHWPITNRIIPGKSDAETLKCIRAFDRDVIIYTDSGLYRLTQLGLSFEDSRFEAIESPVGTTSKRGVAVLDGQQGHIFIANTGLYLFDGQRVQEASLLFDSLFAQDPVPTYGFTQAYNDTVIMEALRDKVFISYGYAADNDSLMMVDYETVSDPKASISLAQTATTLFRERAGNKLIAGDADGRLYEMDYGWADNYIASTGSSDTVFWSFATKDYALAEGGGFCLDEVVLDANLNRQPGSASPQIAVTVRSLGTSKTATFSVSNTQRGRIRVKCPQHMKGETVQVSLVSQDTARRIIYSVGFTYRPFQEEP